MCRLVAVLALRRGAGERSTPPAATQQADRGQAVPPARRVCGCRSVRTSTRCATCRTGRRADRAPRRRGPAGTADQPGLDVGGVVGVPAHRLVEAGCEELDPRAGQLATSRARSSRTARVPTAPPVGDRARHVPPGATAAISRADPWSCRAAPRPGPAAGRSNDRRPDRAAATPGRSPRTSRRTAARSHPGRRALLLHDRGRASSCKPWSASRRRCGRQQVMSLGLAVSMLTGSP